MTKFACAFLFAIVVLIALAPAATVAQSSLDPKPLDPKALELPPSARSDGSSAPAADAGQKPGSSLTVPNKVDLGKYDLEFKAGQTKDVNPRTGFDSGELSNVDKIRPGAPDSAMPDYFGLKLTAPTK